MFLPRFASPTPADDRPSCTSGQSPVFREYHNTRRLSRAAFLNGSAALLVGAAAGCQPAPPCLLVVEYKDQTESEIANQKQMLDLSDRINGGLLPPNTYLRASKFNSTLPINQFFQGTLRNPRSIHVAFETALKEPSHGKGTYGIPVLRHLKTQADAALNSGQFIIGIVFTTGGFNDVTSMQKAVQPLAGHPALAMLLVLPVLSTGDTAAKLHSAFEPLGRIARIATQLDTEQALEELRKCTQSCYGKRPALKEGGR